MSSWPTWARSVRHDLDLGAGQQGIAVRRGLEQEHPVAPLRLQASRQIGPETQHQVAGVVVLGAGETRRLTGLAGVGGIVQLQHHILVELDPVGAIHQHQVIVVAGHGHCWMRWARRLPACPVLDAGRKRPVADQFQVVPGGEAIGHATIEGRQPLRVTQDDAFFLPAFQREDAHLERAAVDPFEQGRVALSADDLLVHGAGIVALGHAAFHQVAVHVHGQPRQRRVGRQRKIERALQPPGMVVEIGLIDGGAGEAILDVDVDVELAQ